MLDSLTAEEQATLAGLLRKLLLAFEDDGGSSPRMPTQKP
jgi:hypothetical protein